MEARSDKSSVEFGDRQLSQGKSANTARQFGSNQAYRRGVEHVALRRYRRAMATRLRQCLPDTPLLFRYAKLQDFSAQFVKLVLSRNPGQGLYLWGQAGVGKSHCLAALARHVVISARGECHVRRVTFACLNTAIRSTKYEMRVLRPFLDCDILSLDDIGVGSDLGKREPVSAGRLLTTLVDWRLENRKPTFVTSNKSIESLGFDERILSRLRTFRIVKIEGRDRRVPPGYLF